LELLAGCGSSRVRKLRPPGTPESWTKLVTLDMYAGHKPDIVHDLTQIPYPFEGNTFDEIHLYDVLEHLGQQGDYKCFFSQFEEFYRILKPSGWLMAVSPAPSSPWAWGDPGHTRIVGPECLVFLDQAEYTKQVGVTPMSDYRFCYEADFIVRHSEVTQDLQHAFALQAVKPSRIARV